jgi:P27 family predicted phage terminase small subunit
VTQPTPSAVKKLIGTERPDRANPDEPKPPLVEIGAQPPSWMTDKLARAYWRELVPILSGARMLALTDTTALAILAKAYGRWRSLEDFLDKNGETYDSKAKVGKPAKDEAIAPATQMLRPRPEVAMRDKAEDRLVFLLGKFGMTPSDRTRVAALPQLVGDPSEEFLRGRRSN